MQASNSKTKGQAMPPSSYLAESPSAQLLWARYGTPEKTDHALRLDAQRRNGSLNAVPNPWRVILEPGNHCNLSCDCGQKTAAKRLPSGFLSPDDVLVYLADLWSTLVQVNLFNWGEPLLNPDIAKIIRVLHARQVGTQIHSNLNWLPDGLADALAQSGLDILVASIDGISQEVYQTYRKGGNVQMALEHLRQCVDARNRTPDRHLRIVWRFLCMPHNVHEIPAARAMAADIGVDDFSVGNGSLNNAQWRPQDDKAVRIKSERAITPPYCQDLWDCPRIHWDGQVLPCCYAATEAFIYGDLRRHRWADLFNSEAFMRARRAANGIQDIDSPCAGCWRIQRARNCAL